MAVRAMTVKFAVVPIAADIQNKLGECYDGPMARWALK